MNSSSQVSKMVIRVSAEADQQQAPRGAQVSPPTPLQGSTCHINRIGSLLLIGLAGQVIARLEIGQLDIGRQLTLGLVLKSLRKHSGN